MVISNFHRASNAIIFFIYIEKSFCFQRLGYRCQCNGTADWHLSIGLSRLHYTAGCQLDSRCQLAVRLHVALTTPHLFGFTTSIIHLPAADGSIAWCNYYCYSMRRLDCILTNMPWMANNKCNIYALRSLM